MAEETVMIRVLPGDKERLVGLYGGPSHVAFRKLLDVACPHPERERVYTIAFVADDMNESEPPQMRSGFLCRDCRRYIFAVEKVTNEAAA